MPAIAISILVFPLFDTLRVFTIRLLKGRSPLSPDRHHIHHMLLDAGYSHLRASSILVTINAFYIVLAMAFQHIGVINLLALILISSVLLTLFLRGMVQRRKAYLLTLKELSHTSSYASSSHDINKKEVIG